MNSGCSENKVFYTHCPYNCWPINCGVKVIKNNDKIVEFAGNEFHDASRGMLCVKGQSCKEIHFNKHRITTPLKRKGERGEDKWEEISWDEAVGLISDQLNKNIRNNHPEANALYHSHGNIVQRANWKILTPRFANLADMTLWDGNFPCWYDVGVAQELTGYWGLHDTSEMGENSAALVNWAQDPCASMCNMTPYIIQLKERGGFIATIDPRVTQTAAISDLHIRPRIGSDVILANAIANVLIQNNLADQSFIENHSYGFDHFAESVKNITPELAIKECEISRKDFDALADLYANTKPLCLNLTRGALGKHWNGVNMVRSVLNLTALSGNIGIKGGGCIWGESIEYNQKLDASSERRKDIHFPENNFNAIDRALEEKIVNTLIIVGGNPLSQWPNINRLTRQIKDLEMLVVYDLFLNHTARQAADIVLPATSWIEELGFRTSNRNIYLADKIAEPTGSCKEASWWMNKISKQIGIDNYFPWNSKEDCINDCLDSDSCKGATVERLRKTPQGIPANIPEVPYSDFNFSSPSGKFEFYSQKAVELNLDPLPVHKEPIEGKLSTPDLAEKYPLNLVSSRRNTHFHSFHYSHKYISTLRQLEPEPLLFMHPKDAKERGVKDFSKVEMFNDRGCVEIKIELTTEVSPGQVSLNDCWPELNILTPSATPVAPEVTAATNMGGQPAYQNTLVEIRRIK